MIVCTLPRVTRESKNDDDIFNSVVENYPLKISRAERLYAGEGCNYSIADDTGNKYILKVYKIEREELVSFITTILNFLGQSDIQIHFPRPVKNVRGMDYTLLPDKILVIFHWIKGATLEFVNARIALELGRAVGALDDKLCEFYTTHQRDYSKYESSMWSVTNIHQLDADLETIKYLLEGHYGLIRHTIARFDQVYPVIHGTLNKCLIHNDVNPGNLLYDQNLQLTGIIDFTEICHTFSICEVGVALAYLMQISGSDYVNIGSSFIRGYAKGYHFTVDEKEFLLLLTKLRLSITIIYNTMHVHLGRSLTNVQAQFICNAKELLTKLSSTTNDEFIEKMFPPWKGL